jgi:hypothetical protein
MNTNKFFILILNGFVSDISRTLQISNTADDESMPPQNELITKDFHLANIFAIYERDNHNFI